ncbi:MAG: C1 family peptidase [Candidatus Nitrosocosmicus sp.]|nr:C1 family peptidase [Candidatus Nitrosocosmicus sp.]MDN5866240.1 C1 family peptidase [Candidatus Nitrosocosmicus sp.]
MSGVDRNNLDKKGKPKHRKLGWIPDPSDNRDHIFSAPKQLLEQLPESVDLRKGSKDKDGPCGPDSDKQSAIQTHYIFNQLQTNSCVGNSVATVFESGLRIQQVSKDNMFIPSRLFIYYNARKIRGIEKEDQGAVIRDAFKSINNEGVVSEQRKHLGTERGYWPFDPMKVNVKPDPELYKKALDHQVLEYKRIPQSLEQLKGCLAQGYPFVFGFQVYESFYSDLTEDTGIANLPKQGEEYKGGHAVVAVGYSDIENRFICVNSWGKEWGNKGYFTMPYDYLLNSDLAMDFWSVRLIEKF